MALAEELLRILACPACKGPLEEVEDGLLCRSCSVIYPVREGIPVLLVEEAVKVHRSE